jgi:glycosyltransferase involved in cell wall biosynthesis
VRIVFLSHYSLPHVGGIETAINGVAEELSRRGHDVLHIASNAGEASESDRQLPYRVVRLPALNAFEHKLSVPYPVFGPSLVSTLRREFRGADVVHAHGFLYLTAVLGLPLARRSKVKPVTVLTEHVGHVPYQSKILDSAESLAIASLGRLTLRAAEALVVTNDRVEAELSRLVPGRRFEFIPNGVDTDRFRPPIDEERRELRAELGWSDDTPRVLFVGRPVPKKGIDLALAAAERGGESFELVLVGPKELPNPPAAGVRMLGPQPHERLKLLYRAADALLLPSHGEGFPMTVQESMASGLPVVLLDDPGYRRHLEGADKGVRLSAPDGDSVAAALASVVAPTAVQRAASHAAAEHARKTFSSTKAADDHEELYARIRSQRAA